VLGFAEFHALLIILWAVLEWPLLNLVPIVAITAIVYPWFFGRYELIAGFGPPSEDPSVRQSSAGAARSRA
jgi:hypothetical protein